MHEEALVADLRRKLEEVAQGIGAFRITGVTVRIGSLSHLREATLRGRWPEIVAGDRLRGAELLVEPGPGPDEPGAQEVRVVSVNVDDDVGGPAAPPASGMNASHYPEAE